jgi:PAT family beta-lactamase induction signal transducer AmpG
MGTRARSSQRYFRALAAALGVYARGRVGIVLLLGFSSGLPLALSGETLRVWMVDSGIDLATIGLLTLAGLPYTIKFFWAPVVDALPVPWLSARLGRRRGWLVASQLLLMAMILLLGTRDPRAAPFVVGAGALLVALASATQDIVIDAYRVEILSADEQAAGMASYVAAYRVGMLVSGAGAIALAARLEAAGVDRSAVWAIAYATAAALVGIGLVGTLIGGEPETPLDQRGTRESTVAPARLWQAAEGALSEFLGRKGALIALAFVLFYKLCDALAGSMTAPFVLALGYDKATYAAVVKGLGLAALLIGGLVGGAIAGALPLAAALWLGGVLQMLSIFAFVWLDFQPPTTAALSAAIIVENFSGAIGTVFLVAYISALCRDPRHTATQYALLTALASAGRTVLSSGTGFLVNALGWALFFAATAAAALPSLVLLAWLQRSGHFRALAAGAPPRRTAQASPPESGPPEAP